jgi:hypothetical protein
MWCRQLWPRVGHEVLASPRIPIVARRLRDAPPGEARSTSRTECAPHPPPSAASEIAVPVRHRLEYAAATPRRNWRKSWAQMTRHEPAETRRDSVSFITCVLRTDTLLVPLTNREDGDG